MKRLTMRTLLPNDTNFGVRSDSLAVLGQGRPGISSVSTFCAYTYILSRSASWMCIRSGPRWRTELGYSLRQVMLIPKLARVVSSLLVPIFLTFVTAACFRHRQ